MTRFYVTYPIRLNTRDCYTVIEEPSEHLARLMLNRRLGSDGWAGIYPDEEAAGVQRYGLKEIPLTHGLEDE